MTWVKVCGLRRPAEVAAAVEAGADAVGFVFHEPSPRHLSPSEARRLTTGAGALTVAVTVDLDPDSLLHVADVAGVEAVQPHGKHAADAARAAIAADLAVLRPVRADGPLDLSAVPPDELPLVDSDVVGGTGRAFDWSWLGDVERRYVLAGGLSPANVGTAIAQLRPWGVDASSHLESAPGVKDLVLVREFVRKAKDT